MPRILDLWLSNFSSSCVQNVVFFGRRSFSIISLFIHSKVSGTLDMQCLKANEFLNWPVLRWTWKSALVLTIHDHKNGSDDQVPCAQSFNLKFGWPGIESRSHPWVNLVCCFLFSVAWWDSTAWLFWLRWMASNDLLETYFGKNNRSGFILGKK